MLTVTCICNMPYLTGEGFVDTGKPLINLTLGKRYRAIQDRNHWLRVWDDFDEDYLYPPHMFAICETG